MNLKQEEDFNELSYYTLSHHDPSFIHQHAVDAYGAQTANESTKQIRTIFALVGLYLYLEQNFTGKKVQNFHLLMSKNKMKWPTIIFPINRGEIDVSDVLAAEPGIERDKMIRNWASSVWEEYVENRKTIMELVKKYQNESIQVEG